jgi:hypothetical protein
MKGQIKYIVEKGVDITFEERKRLTSLYPFDTMEVDDSFLLGSHDDKVRTTILQRAKYWAKIEGEGKQFKTRMTDDGFRIWRTK